MINLNRSVIGSLYGGWTPAAAVPAASTIPEGPATITQQGFGMTGSGSTPRACNAGSRAAAISTAALVALAVMWAVLPH